MMEIMKISESSLINPQKKSTPRKSVGLMGVSLYDKKDIFLLYLVTDRDIGRYLKLSNRNSATSHTISHYLSFCILIRIYWWIISLVLTDRHYFSETDSACFRNIFCLLFCFCYGKIAGILIESGFVIDIICSILYLNICNLTHSGKNCIDGFKISDFYLESVSCHKSIYSIFPIIIIIVWIDTDIHTLDILFSDSIIFQKFL